jgi:NTE family protein
MHVARLVAPKLDGEDHTKDIDFTPAGSVSAGAKGYADTRAMIERAPWRAPVDPMDGVVIHDLVRAAKGNRTGKLGREVPAA